MKTNPIQIIIGAVALYASATTGKAQNFANLNFEAGLGSPVDSGNVYTLPDWNVTTIGDQGGATSGGVAGVGGPYLLDGTYGYIVPPQGAYNVFTGGTLFPIDGDFSVALYVSDVSGPPAPASISISQTGTIPSGQNSVSFLLGHFATYDAPPPLNPLGYFSLSINGQNVPLVVTSQNGQVLTVAGDVSQWAGQAVTLSIANTVEVTGEESFGVIDDVAFSPQIVVVPESSGMGLLSGAISLSVVVLNRRKLG